MASCNKMIIIGIAACAAAIIFSSMIYLPDKDKHRRLMAKSSALAMRGKNFLMLIQRNPQAYRLLSGCSNATQFASMILGAEDRSMAFDKDGCLWNILASAMSCQDQSSPVLISANFNPQLLSTRGKTNNAGLSNELLPIGKRAGADRSLLDDEQVVVVRKDGNVQIVNANRLTTSFLLVQHDSIAIRSGRPWG